MRTCGIYAIRNTVNGKAYIGSAGHIENRWAVHRYDLNRKRHHSPKLQNAWNKYGEAAFIFEIIETVEPDALLVREQYHIDQEKSAGRDTGYNTAKVAGSPRGYKHTPEARANMSAAGIGRKFTLEHRAKISAALKGRRPSDQTIAASIAFHTGAKHSPELVEKRTACLRGKIKTGDALKNIRSGAAARRSFNDMTADLILAEYRAGTTRAALARRYGCSLRPINMAIAGHYKKAS